MAGSDQRLEALEDELKLLKGEVKRTLVDLRAFVMREDSPLNEPQQRRPAREAPDREEPAEGGAQAPTPAMPAPPSQPIIMGMPYTQPIQQPQAPVQQPVAPAPVQQPAAPAPIQQPPAPAPAQETQVNSDNYQSKDEQPQRPDLDGHMKPQRDTDPEMEVRMEVEEQGRPSREELPQKQLS